MSRSSWIVSWRSCKTSRYGGGTTGCVGCARRRRIERRWNERERTGRRRSATAPTMGSRRTVHTGEEGTRHVHEEERERRAMNEACRAVLDARADGASNAGGPRANRPGVADRCRCRLVPVGNRDADKGGSGRRRNDTGGRKGSGEDDGEGAEGNGATGPVRRGDGVQHSCIHGSSERVHGLRGSLLAGPTCLLFLSAKLNNCVALIGLGACG